MLFLKSAFTKNQADPNKLIRLVAWLGNKATEVRQIKIRFIKTHLLI